MLLPMRVNDEVKCTGCQVVCALGRDGAGKAGSEWQGGEGLAELNRVTRR